MRHAILITFARLTASLAQAVNLILLARGVTPEAFGVASSFIGVCLFVTVATDLGVSTVVLKYGRLPGGRDSRTVTTVRSAYTTAWLQSAAAGAMTAVIGLTFYASSLPVTLLVCASVWTMSERAFETIFSGLIAQESMWRAELLLVSRRIVSLGTQVVLLATGMNGIDAFGYSLLIGMAAGCLTLLGGHLRNATPFSRPLNYPIRESLGFWIAATSTQSRDLETPIVHQVAGATQAGLHSVAYRLQRPVSMLAISLAQVVLPKVSVERGRAAREIKVIWLAAVSSLGLTLLALPFVAGVIALVLGAAYVPAASVAQVALIGAVPFAFCAPLGATMQAVGRASEVATIGSASAVVGILAAFAGAYLGGAMGAVLACGIAYLIKFATLSVRAYQLASQHESALGARR